MAPPCRPPVDWLTEHTRRDFAASKKKHLLITGQKRIGKSTLLQQMLGERSPFLQSGLLVDENNQPKSVYLRQPNGGFSFLIGSRTAVGMKPKIHVLNSVGVRCAQQLLASPEEIVGIDEIGFLEQSCEAYQQKLLTIFREKSVIAAVRKDSYPFLQQLLSDPSSFVVDLDNFCKD